MNSGDLEFIETGGFLKEFFEGDLPKNALGYIKVYHSDPKGIVCEDMIEFMPMVFNEELLCASKEKEDLFRDYTGNVYEEFTI